MCGIVGYVGRDDDGGALGHVRTLLEAQAHRGPDDGGVLVYDPMRRRSRFVDRDGVATPFSCPDVPLDRPAPTVVLGSRRLAILDRSANGRQPMATPDHRYAIVLNGEIYNYRELGRALEAHGHRFRSRTDTEVVLAAYAEWGSDCLTRLVGMFAFAVLDTRDRRLFLARDPFGIKPLHYAAAGEALVFASEMSALLRWPGMPRRVAAQTLYEYLDRGVIDHGEETLFEGVRALPPAHCVSLSLDNGPHDPRPSRYWTPDLSAELEISFEEAVRRLRDLFLESIALHLRSDVPVGVLLSGGTDSSSVTMAMRHVGGKSLDIHTFSYIGEHGAASEERWIDIVNAAAGAVPHKVRLDPAELATDLERLVGAQDEPFGSLAIYAQSRLFRRAREVGVPVVLSGTGSDEMLAGYEWFWPPQLADLLDRRDLASAGRLLAGVTRRSLKAAPRLLASALLLKRPGLAARIEAVRSSSPWIDRSWPRFRGVVGRRWPVTNPRVFADRIWHRVSVGLPDLLRYEDRGGMAASVEARVPFLTRELVEFALALPTPCLMSARGRVKHALRKAMRGIVPDEILDRSDKVGFSVPVESWPHLVPGFGAPLEQLARVPPVRSDVVARLLETVRTGRPFERNMVFPLWRLWGLGAWARHFDVAFE